MVRIRMQRAGRRNRPFYRIQVQDKRERRDGAFIEQIGWYNPLEKDQAKQIGLDEERARHWISVGAQPSDTVMAMLVKRNLVPDKRKAEWEAQRARDRKRVEDKKAADTAAAEAPKPAAG